MKSSMGTSLVPLTALVVLVLVVGISSMGGAMAQASCLSVAGASTSAADANTAIQSLRTNPGQCCQTNCNAFCTVMLTAGDAALSICGGCGFCLSCADAGNDLNIALSQCIDGNNQVEAAFGVTGSSQILYVTNVNNRPT